MQNHGRLGQSPRLPRSGAQTGAAALFVTALALAGCKSRTAATPKTPPAADPAEKAVQFYGEALAAGDAMPLSKLLADPERFKTRTITVTAQVRRACTRKGCWMELAEGEDNAQPGCRVTFKDYGFFVPLDSAGSHARVQGTIEVSDLSASMVRHYEEEGAVFPKKNPDGTVPEVRIVATGVELWREPS